MKAMISEPLAVAEQEYLDKLVASQRGHPGSLLSILEKAQERNPRKYLPRETLEYIAFRTGTAPARIYSVVTFYALFNLEPQGQHTVCVCRGTACHTRGSRGLLETLLIKLGLHDSSEDHADKISINTADGRFTVRTVACFGQCALAPVVEVDHSVYGHMNEQTLERELDHLGREKAKR